MSSSQFPNHRIADSFVGKESTTLTVMCNATLFEISLHRADIQGTIFEPEYKKRLQTFTTNDEIIELDEELPDDSTQFDDFCDWIIQPCISLVQQLAPAIQEVISLQSFAFPKTHSLRLIPEGNRLSVKQVEKYPANASLSTVPVAKLNRALAIRIIRATVVSISPDSNGSYDHTCDVPKRVHVAGQKKFFKPLITFEDFERELINLDRISKAGLIGQIKVPELFGIVFSKDETLAIGMLLNWMPFGSRTLWDRKFRLMSNFHSKWETQVRETVRRLHANNIVWGDVNPGNIVIDFQLDAWVIDFAGGYIDGFVDKKLAGTKEGDLDGIHRIFHQWIESDD